MCNIKIFHELYQIENKGKLCDKFHYYIILFLYYIYHINGYITFSNSTNNGNQINPILSLKIHLNAKMFIDFIVYSTIIIKLKTTRRYKHLKQDNLS